MIRVAIIDYEMSNLFSVQHACKHVGLTPVVTNTSSELLKADAAILPGVGAFHEAMKNLERLDLVVGIKNFIDSGKPFMGICLGLQLLFTESDEFGYCKGLNIIEGEVKKFLSCHENGRVIKIPQISWNKIMRSPISTDDLCFQL